MVQQQVREENRKRLTMLERYYSRFLFFFNYWKVSSYRHIPHLSSSWHKTPWPEAFPSTSRFWHSVVVAESGPSSVSWFTASSLDIVSPQTGADFPRTPTRWARWTLMGWDMKEPSAVSTIKQTIDVLASISLDSLSLSWITSKMGTGRPTFWAWRTFRGWIQNMSQDIPGSTLRLKLSWMHHLIKLS